MIEIRNKHSYRWYLAIDAPPIIMKSSQLSNEQLLIAVRKKQECNAKALSIVVSLLERRNKAEDFIAQLPYINQSHYNDVVDERCIIRICGYPLCEQQLENIPTKRYEISTTTNKVYDITERKKFCCAHCFKASAYIRSQISESPLWLHNQRELRKFKLLEINKNNEADNMT